MRLLSKGIGAEMNDLLPSLAVLGLLIFILGLLIARNETVKGMR